MDGEGHVKPVNVDPQWYVLEIQDRWQRRQADLNG